ncbi:MAG: glycosyltransferase family 4 protein [Desulfovermiculus sp.]|nr:glycosyltransferase family 4 protein [Desulfovermiculus sp.]
MPGIRREEKLRRSLASKVDAAICVSTALANYATDGLGIRNVMVLPNAGPLISQEEIEDRQAKRSHKAFTVFYSGSAMYPWQGLDILAGAINLAQSQAPDIRFVLAVNQRTEYLPGGPNVEIREGLNRESILDSICCADACVALHPEYPWSPYGFHNSPMKLFEYMACMRPVVTSNRGQMAELITNGESGLLCSDVVGDILQHFIQLRDQPELAKSMGLSGWNMIQQDMNWENNASKTLSLFHHLENS